MNLVRQHAEKILASIIRFMRIANHGGVLFWRSTYLLVAAKPRVAGSHSEGCRILSERRDTTLAELIWVEDTASPWQLSPYGKHRSR